MIDLRRLRVLRAVAYYGTVTAAAEALHLTPSAASQQVRQLGRELGVVLLEPHGRNVRLTMAARKLLEHADAIVERWQRAEAELRTADSAEPVGELWLSGITTAVSALFVPAVVRLAKRWPGLRLRLRESEPPESFDLLFSGSVDLVVTMLVPEGPPAGDARFDQRPLLDDPYDLLTPPDHPLAGRTDLTLANLAEEDWIVSMVGTACRSEIVAMCATAGFTPTIVHEALEWAAVATMVGHGLGIALLPRLAPLPMEPAVVRTPMSIVDSPTRRLLTVTRKGSAADPAIAAVLAELTEIASERVGGRPRLVRSPDAVA
ncbi:DNA-binding transcriptional LysR family regulator [Tamaricihabitans halophyticus]|uniref:DNA-binding transcriptional LysR family regulator n=1 Tax=Tamaricihabitans halophyticus TaxID=1262583 RepID=A0A4R2QWL3_9PSEU|nr:LysR family transcriptional regulator [Tamaricihabitans halophyticus]TCP53519.1 DNA-binding transcriptional LysR family regulator [Tamaricihabitans halophyticus]